MSIASEEPSKCLILAGLLPLAISPDQSIVTPLNTWLEQICMTDRCSDDTTIQIFNNFYQACADDIALVYGIYLYEDNRDYATQM